MGLTQREFGDKIGVVQGFISDIEKGKKVPSDVVVNAICGVFGVEEEWLRFGGGEMLQEMEPSPAPEVTKAPPEDERVTRIPLLKKVPREFPQVSEDDVIGYLLSSELPQNCFAVKAQGDFMAPTIKDSDSVIFIPAEVVESGDIVLLSNLWGDIIIRRYRRTDDGRNYFTTDNTNFKPFQGEKDTRIIGKVIDIWRRIKL